MGEDRTLLPSGYELYFQMFNSIDYCVIMFYIGVVLSYFAVRFLLYTTVTSDCLQGMFSMCNCCLRISHVFVGFEGFVYKGLGARLVASFGGPGARLWRHPGSLY